MDVQLSVSNWINDVFNPTLKEALNETKQKVLEEKELQFENHGANDWDSTEFPELSDYTIAKKTRKNRADPTQALVDTGELESSLYMSDDPFNWEIKSDSDHAAPSEVWLSKKGGGHSFRTLSPSEVRGAVEFLASSLERGLTNATD